MFSAMSLNRYGSFCEEGRNFRRYKDLLSYLFFEGVLIELDETYTSDANDYWRVIIYKHDKIDEELTDDMEYKIFYPNEDD